MRPVLIAAGAVLVAIGIARAVAVGEAEGSTYGDVREGWTVDVPSDWNVQAFDDDRWCTFRGYRSAVILTDTDFEFHGPRPGEPDECVGRFILAGFPRDGVALAFQPSGIAIGIGVPDCLEPPIDRETLLKVRVQGSGAVKVGYQYVCAGPRREGPTYVVKTWVGRDAPAAAIAELDRALASFRFLRPPASG